MDIDETIYALKNAKGQWYKGPPDTRNDDLSRWGNDFVEAKTYHTAKAARLAISYLAAHANDPAVTLVTLCITDAWETDETERVEKRKSDAEDYAKWVAEEPKRRRQLQRLG